MLAKQESKVPAGEGWRYEPKWDGFRAIVFRTDSRVDIRSRNDRPLNRYFPDLAAPLTQALPQPTVVDGEIIIAGPRGLDFDALQLRLHPAASRVSMLSEQTAATFILFDLLALGDEDLRSLPLDERRRRLREVAVPNPHVALTPQTDDAEEAAVWFTKYEGAGLDGLVAKRAEGTYRSGERGWVKVKHLRTVDCVVGGYRVATGEEAIGSLLLGLYSDEGVLHYVGHTSSFSARERRELLAQLAPLVGGESFGHGRTPGGPSRWSSGRESEWVAVTPSLTCEVSFDHLQGERFRHAATFRRWRPDKSPAECTYDQLTPPEAFALEDIVEFGTA